MAKMTSKRNLLIPDLHHEIGVIDESRVVHKLLIRHGLFQKCICERDRRNKEKTEGVFCSEKQVYVSLASSQVPSRSRHDPAA